MFKIIILFGFLFSIGYSEENFSSDKYLIFGTLDNTINLWNIKKGKLERRFHGNIRPIISIISNDETFIVSGSERSTDMKLFDIKSGKHIKTFYGHSSGIRSISINEKNIISSSNDGSIKLWDIKSGKCIKTLRGYLPHVARAKITPNKDFIISTNFNNIEIWDIANETIIQSCETSTVYDIAVLPKGDFFISGGAEIKLWNLKTLENKIIQPFTKPNEDIASISISPNGKYMLSGDFSGNVKLWDIKKYKVLKVFKNDFHKNISSVKFSSDGKKILYNSEDGAKIYDMESQKELLSIQIFSDGEWVAITPKGYFNASKNGAKYLNILTSPMTVTSIDAYYEKFYRPDIVKLALQGKIVDTGLKMSDIKPAPSVEIVGLPNRTTKKQIEVTLKLKDMGGGIGDIRIYRNGTAISLESRTIQRSQKGVVTKKYTIPLEKGKNKIEAIAFENSNSAKSKPPATATVMANYTNHSKPSLHAVVIGIEEFRNQKLNLRYTKADAKALKNTLERYSKSLFDSVNVTLLTSKEETTKENVNKVLSKMQSLNPNDMFLLFVASHGVVDDGSYYLITSNVGSTRTEKLKQDALSQEEITKLISNIPTGKKIILLDTCSAGALGDSIQLALLTRGMSEDTAIKILSRATGTTILSASLRNKDALEGYKGHGLFSYVLLEGLKKKADLNGDGFVKTPELVDYVDERVPELSKQVFGLEQFPTVNLDGQSFPVTRVE